MTVRSALLQLLDEGERHGYQLKVDFEARTGGIWPLNVGQVYTTLDRLHRDGLVLAEDAAGEASQRLYRITEEGRHEVKRWLTSSAVDANPPRDELIMKVLLAIGRGPDEAIDLPQLDAEALAQPAGDVVAEREQPEGPLERRRAVARPLLHRVALGAQLVGHPVGDGALGDGL